MEKEFSIQYRIPKEEVLGLMMKFALRPKTTILLITVFVLIEWFGREGQYAISEIGEKLNRPFRWMFYSLIIFAIGMFMPSVESTFIYFQF